MLAAGPEGGLAARELMTRAGKAPGSTPRDDPCKAGDLGRRESSLASVHALK
jgi:hypothetical protein